MWATIIGSYFKLGLYTADDVKVFVTAKWISSDDYKTITGADYTPAAM